MKVLKIILLITFFILASALIILSFIIHKDEDDGTVQTASKGSYYGKNTGLNTEAKLDIAMKALFGIFVLNIIALYFVV